MGEILQTREDYVRAIERARVYDVAERTPLELAPCLSAALGNRVLLKREDLQPVFSFKLRGAYNKMAGLSAAERARGVVTASAGNHAQGVALAAEKLGIQARIVMPRTTPRIKVDAVARRRCCEIVSYGDTYDQAYAHAERLAADSGAIFVHPYDDPEVVVGQGTVGMELHQQHPEPLHAVFVPVGGGGLIAGMALYLKHMRPEIRIVGVEPEDAPTLHAALEAGARIALSEVGLFADGAAVRCIGEHNFPILRELVDEVELVTTDQICAAIKDIFDDTRTLAEPAGALAVAGVRRYVARRGLRGETLAAVVSGANINFDRLRHVAERYEIGMNTESLFAATIPERPGSFKRFCTLIGRHTITEFNYRYADADEARVFVGVKFEDAAREVPALVEAVGRETDCDIFDISDNEMAKLHMRYMIGGRGLKLQNERLYRFQFPERPGALMDFLTNMRSDWNISLFHYRNHGSAYGRVLAGVQVPDSELVEFHAFLNGLGYRWHDESGNAAYRFFLR